MGQERSSASQTVSRCDGILHILLAGGIPASKFHPKLKPLDWTSWGLSVHVTSAAFPCRQHAVRASSRRTRGPTATYRRHPPRPRPPSEAPRGATRLTVGLPRSPQPAPALRQAGVPRPERGPPLLPAPAPLSLHSTAAGRLQTSSRPLRRGRRFPLPRLTLAGGRAGGSRRCCEQEARRGGSAALPSRREPSRPAPAGKWGRPAGCLCGSRPSARSNALRLQPRGQAAALGCPLRALLVAVTPRLEAAPKAVVSPRNGARGTPRPLATSARPGCWFSDRKVILERLAALFVNIFFCVFICNPSQASTLPSQHPTSPSLCGIVKHCLRCAEI